VKGRTSYGQIADLSLKNTVLSLTQINKFCELLEIFNTIFYYKTYQQV